MPGKVCAMYECPMHASRNKGLAFFKIRRPKNREWENALVHALRRKDTLNRDNASICSRHFKPECIEYGGKDGTMRKLKEGSLPTEWLPKLSVETKQPEPRDSPTERPCPEVPELVKFYNLNEVRTAAAKSLPAPWVLVSSTDEKLVIATLTEDSNAVKLKVTVEADMVARVHVIGLPARGYTVDIAKTGLKSCLDGLLKMQVCPGVPDPELQQFAEFPVCDKNQRYFRHISYSMDAESGFMSHASTVRSQMCELLLSEEKCCSQCRYSKSLLQAKHERAKNSQDKPVLKNRPLSSLPQDKVVEELKQTRKEKRRLQKELLKFKNSLPRESVEVPDNVHNSMLRILESNKIDNPLKELFWKEQLKAFGAGKNGMRWHPMMIRLAILLHSRSPAAYETLRATGVLELPGTSTLRDYTNVYHPKPGFQKNVLADIRKATKDYKDNERFVILLHDEMTIKSDLVFDKRSGELVGFINGAEGGNRHELATHALVFYVVGVNTSLSCSLGFFGTHLVTADLLYPLFWKAVGLLETECQLKVIASTSDKATPNQRLYDLHGTGVAGDVCYKTVNPFAPDRDIFFISDPPHLIKTVRNNLNSSGGGKQTRYMWRNGQHMLWSHVRSVYDRDVCGQLRRSKLTHDHVFLTRTSVMNVRLAAQVLSQRVGRLMSAYGGQDCQETANFILAMDRFFDCLNGRSQTEGIEKRKPDLLPYKQANDPRFGFLANFLDYLTQWKSDVDTRPGNFSKAERSKMFLSLQTYKGLVTTLKAFPEVTRYLLANGVEFVLPNRFCQDPIEHHFGRQRGLGRRSENPNLWTFAYNENRLRLSRTLGMAIQPQGNVRRKRKPVEGVVISTSPLKKIKRS